MPGFSTKINIAFFLALVGCLTALPLAAQESTSEVISKAISKDSIPLIVEGAVDWRPLLRTAPKRMNQKDYAMYMVRKNKLEERFFNELNQNWVNDWHFFDANGDRLVDAVFSGKLDHHEGWYTYMLYGDSALTYPISFEAPGYVHLFEPQAKGLEIILRNDASGKRYLHRINHYFLDTETDSTHHNWEVQIVSTTEVPEKRFTRQPFALYRDVQLRTSPRVANTPTVDYDQDEKPDAAGNIVASYKAGAPCFRYAEMESEGMNWSFVMVLQAPEGKHVFKPIEGLRTGFCGWVPTVALLGD
ncbi:MAG: hypothetical protein AAF570_15145 [Bacteroidota bacterium]